MKELKNLSKQELESFLSEEEKKMNGYISENLSINMARGKPSPEQLDMSQKLFENAFKTTNYISREGIDTRNYGNMDGIDESKEFFAEMLSVPKENVIVGGNASLELMFDFISQCCVKGIGGCEPWLKQKDPKFIAIVPGYDRHFAITEYFGLKMINVPVYENGPDMDMLGEVIKDPSVKGMFCVPKYSNPDGFTYSDETVEAIAKMKPAAKDFRVIWDNAYYIHDLYDETEHLSNIFEEAKKNGNEDYFIEFASTSKVTFAGAGISCIVASDNNIAEIKSRMKVQIISYDKMNQLRHAIALPDMAAAREQMKREAAILRPKFKTVLEGLDKGLNGLGIAKWHDPKGGYFIGLRVMTGSASYAGELCKKAGLTLTKVGAAFPYNNDPDDMEIRIAPSYPSVEDLKKATEILTTAVRIAAARELLGK